MATIAKDAKLITLINVFTVTPDRQEQLVRMLDEATEEVMQHQPGFISANIHASRDGHHVTDYAQWESEDAFQSMLKNPVAQKHMKACSEIAEAAPVLYDVKSVFDKSPAAEPQSVARALQARLSCNS